VKIVHAADLHLDSPLCGLARYEGAPVDAMRGATRRALENLVDLCLGEGVALLLLAGDLFDGDWKDYATGLFFAAQMSRLRQGDIDVIIVRGNHDAVSHITKHLELPSNVRELATTRPESVELERWNVAVHGQSYGKRAVTADLASKYPEPIAGAFNIGLLHTALTGRPGHEPYAPCSPETLRAKGYDYWALGHVHAREQIGDDAPIVFPGNLQARHARETGPKGATLIDVSDGRIAGMQHRVLDAVRWARCEVDVSEAGSGFDVIDSVRAALEAESKRAEGRPLAARVVVVGATPAHATLFDDPDQWHNQIRAAATDAGEVWVEKIQVATRPVVDLDELAARDDAVGQVVRALREGGDARLGELGGALGELGRKLPKELRERGAEGGLRLDDPDELRAIVSDAEQLLLGRLLAAMAER
jgi:DNA repair exonuclease SbcCD nuclease subunit